MSPNSQKPGEGQYLNPTSVVPKYFHFSTVICERFCHLPVGTLLPALTELAKRFSVSKETINRSMRYLAQRGYVKSERGRGTYIVKDLREAIGIPMEPLSAPMPRQEVDAPRQPVEGSQAGLGRVIGMVLKSRKQMVSPDRNVAEIEIIGGLQHRLQEEGIVLATVVVNNAGEYDLKNQLNSIPGIGGFVFMTNMLTRAEAEAVASLKRPTVMINEESISDLMTCIVACEEEGMASLVEHLYALGHRKVVYLSLSSGDKDLPRFKGYEAALGRLPGMEGAIYDCRDWMTLNRSAGERVAALLKQFPGSTAFIGGATEAPVQLCLGLQELGMTPGKEISVAAFGLNTHELGSVAEGQGRLTTVIKPRYEMGQCAAETLINQFRQKYQQTGVIKIPTSVEIGTTTGPVPRAPEKGKPPKPSKTPAKAD